MVTCPDIWPWSKLQESRVAQGPLSLSAGSRIKRLRPTGARRTPLALLTSASMPGQCPRARVRAMLHNNNPCIQGLYSSVAERQSCQLKVLGSIPSGGCIPCHCLVLGLLATLNDMAMCSVRPATPEHFLTTQSHLLSASIAQWQSVSLVN